MSRTQERMVRAPDAARLNATGQRVIGIEAAALAELAGRLPDGFADAAAMMLAARGRVILSGMGKSGHIARKIAATLASTGTPALYVHPAEASHGDLGMITAEDVVLLLSNSGETEEILRLLEQLRELCTRALWMDRGRLTMDGPIDDVLEAYRAARP